MWDALGPLLEAIDLVVRWRFWACVLAGLGIGVILNGGTLEPTWLILTGAGLGALAGWRWQHSAKE